MQMKVSQCLGCYTLFKAPPPPLKSVPFLGFFYRFHSRPRKIVYLPVAFILIMLNENKTSTSLETLQRFENEVFLKSPLLLMI